MKKLILFAFTALGMFACTGQNVPSNPNSTKGALPGKFSVSETSKVQFSQGNLQYEGTWQFAEHQWDYFGENQSDGHRDLFGWGTGDTPNKVSDDKNDYTTFTDWGENTISNGGNKANIWRTLTRSEWKYLFFGRTNAANLFGMGKVNGINGTILLPDDWSTPQGITFNASSSKGLKDYNGYGYYTNPDKNNYSHNSYTVEQWSVMESAGAVFLPAAGRRTPQGNYTWIAEYGLYWSSTSLPASRAYQLLFDKSSLHTNYDDYNRAYGFSVRLVR